MVERVPQDPLSTPSVTVAVEAEALLGEGTCWDPTKQCLYWVDILQKQLHVYEPNRDLNTTHSFPEPVSAVVPTIKGTLLIAMKRQLIEFHVDSGNWELLVNANAEPESNRFNDGKCDPGGRFWIGSMDQEGAPGRGSLYLFSDNNHLEVKLAPVGIANGLAWTPDCNRLYFIDTLSNTICAYPLSENGTRLGPSAFVLRNPFPNTHLDGMTIDEQGMLWVAVCGGGCIIKVDPDTSDVTQVVHLPVKLPTNCTFGGPLLTELYVTSARETLTIEELQQHPLSGSVLKVTNLGVRGLPSVPFS